MKKKSVLGLMSGTSLDGLDCCAVDFEYKNGNWHFDIIRAETFKYNRNLYKKLEKSKELSSIQLLELDVELGNYFGQVCNEFIGTHNLKVDFISSHGHTIFHQPEKQITLQIGNGQIMSNITKLPVVFDFRTKDVSLGGQGAPLVPIGDMLLFNEYDVCVNLGGIANLSFDKNSDRIAFDVCSCNMGLNYLANQLNLEYDESGKIAKSGKADNDLLIKLNELAYFKMPYPKSLGAEWFEKNVLTIIQESNISIADKLATLTEHIAFQLAEVINSQNGQNVLFTGGGALNTFLIDLIKGRTSKNIQLPSKETVEFKEALVFGFLGVLRMENINNVLSSVTGASKNSCSGIVAWP